MRQLAAALASITPSWGGQIKCPAGLVKVIPAHGNSGRHARLMDPAGRKEFIQRAIDIHLAFKYGKVYRKVIARTKSNSTPLIPLCNKAQRKPRLAGELRHHRYANPHAVSNNSVLANSDAFKRYLFAMCWRLTKKSLKHW